MKTTLFATFLLLAVSLSAQSVKGIVVDKNGTPVSDARVVIKDVWSSQTDDSGIFEITLPKKFSDSLFIVLDVQKNGMELMDVCEILVNIREHSNELIMVRMAPLNDLAESTSHIGSSMSYQLERSYKAKVNEYKLIYQQMPDRLKEETVRLKREYYFAEELFLAYREGIYRTNLSTADSTYRLAYGELIKGNIDGAHKIIQDADLQKQLNDVSEYELQGKISTEERQKVRKILAQTAVLDAKLNISLLDFKEAEKAFELAIEADTVSWDVFFDFAVFLQNQNQIPRAEEFYQRALALAKDGKAQATVLNSLGILYSERQEMSLAAEAHNEALNIFRQLANKNADAFLPDVAMTLNKLSILSKIEKKYGQALDYSEEAIRIIANMALKKYPVYVFEWIKVTANVKYIRDSTLIEEEYELASKAAQLMASSCDTLVSADPIFTLMAAEFYGSASWWTLFARDYDVAEGAGLRCLAFDPEQLWVYCNIGHARLLRGDLKQAKETYQLLKGKRDKKGKDFKAVLEQDFHDFEAAGISHKNIRAARRWLERKW